ncbi:hypothetical protein T4E_6996 [Trichinella pseudospiralis]|uniref:Secreted protein n=1 Tax=Trichinella pseudospiralis TaxID=6337 RepID=A0A0V0YKF1_TRIPS|nr:hypothetical protein T4E_6996 [Trichinella pseudospiralis]
MFKSSTSGVVVVVMAGVVVVCAAAAAAAAQERITSVPTANSDWPTEQPAVSQLTRRDDIDVASRRTQLTLWANFVVQVLLLPIDRPLKTKKIMGEKKKKNV